jgi:hypothetical protein
MGFDDRWFDTQQELSAAMESNGIERLLSPGDRQAFEDATTVVAYLGRYVDIYACNSDGVPPEGNPITPAFPAIAGKLKELAATIRQQGLLTWDARAAAGLSCEDDDL